MVSARTSSTWPMSQTHNTLHWCTDRQTKLGSFVSSVHNAPLSIYMSVFVFVCLSVCTSVSAGPLWASRQGKPSIWQLRIKHWSKRLERRGGWWEGEKGWGVCQEDVLSCVWWLLKQLRTPVHRKLTATHGRNILKSFHRSNISLPKWCCTQKKL